jgi:hypothetical protein
MDKEPYTIRIVNKGKENRGKTVMLITNLNPLNGFFAEFMITLELLAYADRFGFEPYILYKKDFLYYEEKENKNAFEAYFVQPTKLSMHSVERSCNLFEATITHAHLYAIEHGCEPGTYTLDKTYINGLAYIMNKYIRLNERTDTYIHDSIRELFGDKKKILGVHHRETDFKKQFKNHPVYVSAAEKIRAIEDVENDYDLIFVATDSNNAIDEFKKRWPDKVVFYTDVYRSDGMVSVAFCEDERKEHKYLLGLEVLRDMYTLAHCDGLVAGISRVSVCAQITKKSFGQEYQYLKILDYGINQSGECFHP